MSSALGETTDALNKKMQSGTRDESYAQNSIHLSETASRRKSSCELKWKLWSYSSPQSLLLLFSFSFSFDWHNSRNPFTLLLLLSPHFVSFLYSWYSLGSSSKRKCWVWTVSFEQEKTNASKTIVHSDRWSVWKKGCTLPKVFFFFFWELLFFNVYAIHKRIGVEKETHLTIISFIQ